MFPEWFVFAVKYLINIVPCFGSVVFMLTDLAHGGRVPSYGIKATLINVLIMKYPGEEVLTTNGTRVCQSAGRGPLVYLLVNDSAFC